MVDKWGAYKNPKLTPIGQIGHAGTVGYNLVTGGSGLRTHTLYSRSGNKIREFHTEVALINMGLGPIDYLLLGAAAVSLGKYAIGKFAAKRAAAAEAKAAAANSGGQKLEDEFVSVFHGSINDATRIRNYGFDPSRGTVYVSRDLGAAKNAIGPNRYEISQGIAKDPGIIESRIPQADFNRVMTPLERPYRGFHGGNLGSSSEIVLRTKEAIELFNKFIGR